MIRIGLVNIDISHPKAFNAILKNENRARYAAVFNEGFRGEDEVEGFIKNAGLEKRADTIEELADISDIGFIQACNWDKHIDHATPFIKKGKPVFIDKPIVGNLDDCGKLVSLVENGAVILGSSSIRYNEDIEQFLAQPVEERGEIAHIYGTSGVDEFNYGIHIVEAIGKLTSLGAESCILCNHGTAGGKPTETYNIAYKNGASATYTLMHGAQQPFMLTVMTNKQTVFINASLKQNYKSLLDKICDYMETGVNKMATVYELTESIKIMLAGKASRENGGIRVPLADLKKYNPVYDGYAFEREYAAAGSANKIYLTV